MLQLLSFLLLLVVVAAVAVVPCFVPFGSMAVYGILVLVLEDL